MRFAMAALAMVILGIAGVAKLFDLEAFRASLETWTIIPKGIRGYLDWIVPAIEVFVATCWLVGPRTSVVKLAASMVIVAIAMAYAAQVWLGNTPECNCLGVLARYLSFQKDAKVHLGVLCIMFTLVAVCPTQSRTPPEADSRLSEPRRHPTSAFTIVEMMMVIVVIGILIALALPLVRSSKGAGERAANHAQLRSHAAIFSLYSCDYNDAWPAPTSPAPPAPYRWKVTMRDLGDFEERYFVFGSYWTVLLVDSYYNTDYVNASFSPPRFGRGLATPYEFSSAFLADPSFWRYEMRTGPTQWRGTFAHEVLFPSAKALLANRSFATLDENVALPSAPGCRPSVHFATVDGAALSRSSLSFLPTYSKGEGNWEGAFRHFGIPALHTMGGVQGRDFTR